MATVPASSPLERRESSLSGARADFVAQLGRRVSELRLGLQALEAEPGALRPRDDLKRRFHALGSAARVLKFQVLADELLRLEQVLLRSSSEGGLDAARLATMRADVDSLVSLAWGEAAPPPVPVSSEVNQVSFSWPATALVVGGALLAEALLPEMNVPGDVMLECERVEQTAEALEMARALAPDVVVLDTELPGSQELVEKLASDPLTEPVPVIAVGTFSSPERAARWVALGVARVLARPFTPRQLQEACSSVVAVAHQHPRPEPFGQLTLEQLVARLSEELQRGLCDAALDQGRMIPIPLGDGHEVVAAFWSALVRIREVATLRSGGLVRFQNLGPEGAVAVASWSSDVRGGRAQRSSEDDVPRRLDDRTALVVDDDPSVTWFLSGVLKAAGARVLEAHDGETALRLAQRYLPDLVISDILMPKLDGFALCRALKRDVVLRDVPVILLSWKEDLLQRVRELGANADGYLRKEASAAVVLERVFEVLRPRLRVERRLLAGGEVRGRLDDLTVRTLLSQVTRLQPNARVSVRDAAFFYEVEIREGVPRSATRTTPKGNFERGPGVMFNLLGVGAGRFVVTPSDATLRGWLDGSLAEQIRPAIAQIRAAQRLLSGTELMNVQGVDLNLEAIQPYLEASPATSRDILDKLAEGFSPRALLLRGGYSARLLEDVLNDAILHGGVARVVGTGGDDLLPSAVEQELAFLESGARAEASEIPEAALYAQITPSPLQMPVQPASAEEVEPSPARDVAVVSSVPPAVSSREEPVRVEATSVAPTWTRAPAAPSPFEQALLQASPSPVAAVPAAPVTSEGVSLLLGTPLQVSVEESVYLTAPEPSVPPSPVQEPSSDQSIAQEVAPPAVEEKQADAAPVLASVPSPAPSPVSAPVEAPALAAPESEKDVLGELSAEPPPVEAALDREEAPSEEAAVPSSEPEVPSQEESVGPPPVLAVEQEAEVSRETSSAPELSPGPQTVAPREPAIERRGGRRNPWGGVIGVIVLGVVGSFWAMRDDPKSSAPPTAAAVRPEPAPESRPSEPVSKPLISVAPVASSAALGVEELPLDPGESVPEGQGVLEIEAGQRDELLVDRREVGRGAQVRVVLPAGVHELRSRRKGDEQPLTVVVRAGRKTRVDLRGPWHR